MHICLCGKMRTKLPERRGRDDGEVKRRAKNKGKPLKSRPQFYRASHGMKIQSKEEEDVEAVSNKSLGMIGTWKSKCIRR